MYVYKYTYHLYTHKPLSAVFFYPSNPLSVDANEKERDSTENPNQLLPQLVRPEKNDPPWNGFISHLWRKIIGTQLPVKGDMDSFPGKLRWNPKSRGFGGKMIFRISSVGDFSLPAVDFQGCFYTFPEEDSFENHPFDQYPSCELSLERIFQESDPINLDEKQSRFAWWS